MTFILFPTQLFEQKYIPKEYHTHKFYLIEHERFYGMTDKMNFNKKKIILHKASCLAYIDEMENKLDIKYVLKYPVVKKSVVVIFDVVDKYITHEIIEFYTKLSTKVKILNSPNFMTNIENLNKYFIKNKNSDKFFHHGFYNFQLKLHNIPYIKKSYDTENRNAIPKNTKLPKTNNKINNKIKNNKYVKDSIEFVNKRFSNNYGDTDNFYLPITHTDAKKWFNDFLKIKMKNFAEFQDAIIPEEPFLFHSVISAVLNIGLLNPDYIINTVISVYENKQISIQDYEAFIRQIIGWREYQRFIYVFLQDKIINKNHFGNTNKLSKHWYDGTLGIPPVDDAIKMAFKYGYLHHIMRLMVMCNFMNLCGINPHEVYKWFMEFSTDSYEWVMIGNVYSMGMWADGGMTMRKPYFSSANYVQNMAGNRYDFGEWEDMWKALYYNFLSKNKKKLEKTIYRRNLTFLDKMDKTELNKMKKKSNEFIKKYTKNTQ
jgi:deoxyribodipyrimidine photolyase-related protein